ncbi:MAG: cell wall-binding repeat-containing protein [Parcubacteria group bacterium]
MNFFSLNSVQRGALGLALLSLAGFSPVWGASFSDQQYWLPGEAERLAGADRYETATKVSEFEYGAAGIASRILVASGENFPDALVAGPLASMADIPFVLTAKNELPEATRRHIKWVFDGIDDAESDIWLIGGPNAVNETVVQQLRAIHPNLDVERIQGIDRVETASNIAWLMQGLRGAVPNGMFIVDKSSYPDALVASAPAGDPTVEPGRMPIFLTNGEATTLDPLVRSNLETYLKAGMQKIYIVGGPAAVNPLVQVEIQDLITSTGSTAQLQFIGGYNRYKTAFEVASQFYGNLNTLFSVGLASGENFPDALVGASDTSRVAATQGEQAFLLTRPEALPSETEEFLKTYESVLKSAVIYGGERAVSATVEQQLESYLQ